MIGAAHGRRTIPWIPSLIVFATGWVVFRACSWIAQRFAAGPVIHQAVLKSLLVLSAFGLIAAWRTRVPGTYGFSRSAGVRWSAVVGAGLALGAAASLTLLLLGGRGMQSVIGSMRFYEIVIFVWIGSSVSEEIFVRGWAQGALVPVADIMVGKFSLPVVTAAILFGAMHLTLFERGVDPVTATTLVISTTLLGLLAGRVRERYGGLAPAIGAHMSFNVGGMIGGILYMLGYRLLTGRLPVTS